MNWNFIKKLSTVSAGSALVWYYNRKDVKSVFCATAWDYNWDKREIQVPSSTKIVKRSADDKEFEKDQKSSAIRHLILIRHGQYNLNGATDAERILTETGRVQAKITGDRLKELKIPFDNVVISTMSRAQETGHIILDQLPQKKSELKISHEPLIEEGSPAVPEPPIGGFRPEFFFFKDSSRIETGYRSYFYRAHPTQEKDSYTLMVCHANVIRYFVCRALQFPAEAWLRFSLHHASITWLTIMPDGRVILRLYGDSGHMPIEYLTR